MKARCKFRVTSVTDFGNDNKKIALHTQYDPELAKEDIAFAKATPSGSMEVQISNPHVLPMFVPGREFYVDLIPVDAES